MGTGAGLAGGLVGGVLLGIGIALILNGALPGWALLAAEVPLSTTPGCVLTLLAAVAGWTERVLLGPACTGSIALRDPRVFAYEWAERGESPPDFGDFPQPAELRRRYPVI